MSKLLKKGNKLYSVLYNYCPKCHIGKFWPVNNPYRNILVMNNGDIGSCKNCNFKYEMEPGFWYGAMYVSYAITVFIAMLVWFIIHSINDEIDLLIQIFTISLSLIFLFPVVYFLSRLIWINFFVSYDNHT